MSSSTRGNRRRWGLRGSAVVAGVALLLVGGAAKPARAKVFGYGEKTCLEYVEEVRTPEVRRLYTSWAQGYFSAVAYRQGLSDFTRGLGNEPQTLQTWLQRYCNQRNSKKFYEAVDAFTEELIKVGSQKTR